MATAPAAEAKAGLRLAGWVGVKAAAVVELPRAAERAAEAAAGQAGITTCSILFCLPFVNMKKQVLQTTSREVLPIKSNLNYGKSKTLKFC